MGVWSAQGTPAATSYCANAASNAITDCKVYSGSNTTTISLQDCIYCNSKTWLNLTDNATAASRLRTCSDTAISTTTCASSISNCDQSMCFKSAAGAYTAGCRVCKSGYKGGTTAISGNDGTLGYTTCVATTITNSDVGNPTNNAQAYFCKSGYAVSNAGTACTAFSTDSNCRQLGSTGAYCGTCWFAYYFTTTVCTLGTSLAAFAGIVLAALYMM